MPPKSRRQKQLLEAAERARKAKSESVAPDSTEVSVSTAQGQCSSNLTASNHDSEESDGSYNPDEDLSADDNLKLEKFSEEWLVSLDRDDRLSLGLFLSYHLRAMFNFTVTNAAEYAGLMVGRSEQTVRKWRKDFLANGEIPECKQGKYQRSGVLWGSEDLNRKARLYARKCSSKGTAQYHCPNVL